MTNQRTLLQSSPSPELAQLLRSASLDVPPAKSRARAKAIALEALRSEELGRTTQLTSFALGDSVSRLLSSVTLSGAKVSSLRLALRGAAIGTAFGIAALGVVTIKRFALPTPQSAYSQAAGPSEPSLGEGPNKLATLQTVQTLTRADLAREIQAGRGEHVLSLLDAASRSTSEPLARYELTLRRIQTLMLLGRKLEAQKLATAALVAATPAQTLSLKTLLVELGGQ